MRRRGSNNEHRNDDQTHAVARHRSPLFLFRAAGWRICCHCDKTMQSGGNGERERRFIRDVAELSHHPARRLHTQSRMDRRLRISLDTEGWLYMATVLRCSTAVRNLCYGGVSSEFDARRPTIRPHAIPAFAKPGALNPRLRHMVRCGGMRPRIC